MSLPLCNLARFTLQVSRDEKHSFAFKRLYRQYVEIKGQLDATDWFFIAKLIIRSTCFRAPVCLSSGAQDLYRWFLPVLLGALVYRSLVWCGDVGYVSVLRAHNPHITHSSVLRKHNPHITHSSVLQTHNPHITHISVLWTHNPQLRFADT